MSSKNFTTMCHTPYFDILSKFSKWTTSPTKHQLREIDKIENIAIPNNIYRKGSLKHPVANITSNYNGIRGFVFETNIFRVVFNPKQE